MGLVEEINQYLGADPTDKVSPGVVVKAMILNGLGILSAPLYSDLALVYLNLFLPRQ